MAKPKKLRIRKFNKKAGCRKCGGKDIYDKFCTAGEKAYSAMGHTRPTHYYEQIHRTCRNCGYEWEERPLDSPKC